MSWQASGWAKKTRGHKSPAQKLVLMILSDYYQDEEGCAWPSQQRLAEDCEVSIRTVKESLKTLAEEGFISVRQKGNQYQRSEYVPDFTRVSAISAPSQSYEDAPPESAGAAGRKVQVQSTTSEGAIPVGSNLQEPSEEEPPEEKKEKSIPTFLELLRETEGWETKGKPHEASMLRWVAQRRQKYTDDLLEGAAIGLGKVQAKTLRGYSNLSRAFQDRLMKGWDDPAKQGDGRNNGRAPSRRRREARTAEDFEGGFFGDAEPVQSDN